MRIASLHSAFAEKGGAERSILEEAKYLKKTHDVALFATYSRASHCYPEVMKDLDIQQLVGIPFTNFDLLSNVAFGLFLAKSFKPKFQSFDVLISHQQPAHWIAYNSKRPYVVQIHSLLTMLYPEFMGKSLLWDTDYDRVAITLLSNIGGYRLLRWIDSRSINAARNVLVQSKKLSDIVRHIYGIDPVRVPFGIDFSALQWTNPASVFSKYSIKRPLILMVTRLLPIKRADIMIRILPKILRDHPTATLVIACPPSKDQYILKSLALELGVLSSIRIISVTSSELNALYSGADVVGFPSQAQENAPRVVLEAMRFGVPPVVWDNGWGAADIIQDGFGFRARPYDTDDLSDKILALLNDKDMRDRMGRKARSVAENYSWDKVGPVFESILQRAALP